MDVEVITRPPGVGGRELAAATPWRVVVDAFLAAGVDSANTRRAYARHLAGALTAMDVATLAELSGADLAHHRAALVDAGLSPASQGQALAALRSLLRWSGAMGAHRLSGDVVATALRTPRAVVRRPYTVATEAEIARLFAAAATPRDRAILGVLLGAGLRVSELVGLDVRSLLEDVEGGAALHVHGKGRRDRTVPVLAEVATLVRRYLAATGRRLGGDGPLFRAHDPGVGVPGRRDRLSARAVGMLVERLVAAAGIDAKRLSPHALRHTYAMRYLRPGGGASPSTRRGGDVVALSKLLGHASIATTQRYVDHLAIAELRAGLPTLPGLVA